MLIFCRFSFVFSRLVFLVEYVGETEQSEEWEIPGEVLKVFKKQVKIKHLIGQNV